MEGLKIVIVDDEPLAREVLEGYVKRLGGIGSLRLFPNALSALEYFSAYTADLLLLDIEMPEMSGIEFLKLLADPPLTIFTTACRNYAFEGYELGVIDFLLKPIPFLRFEQAITKARELLALKSVDIAESHADFVFVKSGTQRLKLHFNEVSHIQGLKDYAVIYTSERKILLKGSVKAMLDLSRRTALSVSINSLSSICERSANSTAAALRLQGTKFLSAVISAGSWKSFSNSVNGNVRIYSIITRYRPIAVIRRPLSVVCSKPVFISG